MRGKARKPAVPGVAGETVRHALMEVLRRERRTARELSMELRVAEKEVYLHLEHVRRSLPETEKLEVAPATCRRCGFTFVKRDRLTPPGRCPVCRHEAIAEASFAIRPR